MARLGALILEADPEATEEWKWRGTPVWSHYGIFRMAIDIHEGQQVDASTFNALVKAAVTPNRPPGEENGRP